MDTYVQPNEMRAVSERLCCQATGEAEYINDIAPVDGQLYGTFVLSTEGNAQIQTIDPSAALVCLLTNTGKNHLGHRVPSML